MVKGSTSRRLWAFSGLILLFGLMALAWTASPLKEMLDLTRAMTVLRELASTWGPQAGAVVVCVSLTMAVPLSFLTVLALVAYGPVMGSVVTLVGALVAAMVTFGAGKLLAHEAVTQLAGKRLQSISKALGQRGLVAVLGIRLVPVAPFAIVNLVAGSSHIRWRDMLLGTALGMLPGTIGMALFVDHFVAALTSPGTGSWLVVAATAVLIFSGALVVLRWVKKLPSS
jgi:uncharacterized membrane protein YdjX (TVP38/TMEM64 family)